MGEDDIYVRHKATGTVERVGPYRLLELDANDYERVDPMTHERVGRAGSLGKTAVQRLIDEQREALEAAAMPAGEELPEPAEPSVRVEEEATA